MKYCKRCGNKLPWHASWCTKLKTLEERVTELENMILRPSLWQRIKRFFRKKNEKENVT